MTKILGLDLGTNSVGWAVVETEDNKTFEILDKGVRIFQEGVKIEKGVESSKAAERTAYRSARRIKYRRKLRKIATLKVLSKYGYCPTLAPGELDLWRYKKIYPTTKSFLNWQRTDERTNKNPYYYRALAVEEKLDLQNEDNRYLLGRAFYHMSQRRGFLSNRLETTKASDGAVMKEINEINEAKGDNTLGQYFYQLYQEGNKIRNHYTHREKHYLEEFEQICEFQKLPKELVAELKKAIFYQRPLKSQKGLVGKCPFEKNKARCPVSHPLFEEYRLLAFVNNIKIKTPTDDKLRSLNQEEKELIEPLFYRKSKEHFNFEEIAKKLTPKGWPFRYFKAREISGSDYLFNYSMRTTVSGCRTIAQLKDVFGADWLNGIKESYQLQKTSTGLKSDSEIINDIWHVLFSFDKTEKLIEFAKNRLELNDELAEKFSNISLKQEYGSLSLKAIRKILPFLRQGLVYSHAVFMANLQDILPPEIWADESNRKLVKEEIAKIIETQNNEKLLADIVNGIIKINRDQKSTWSTNEFWQEALQSDIYNKLKSNFGKNKWDSISDDRKEELKKSVFLRVEKQMQNNLGKGEFVKTKRIDERIKEFIVDNFDIDYQDTTKLYHPSAVEVYKEPSMADDGNYYLGSPMISSVRNPMAMRALHQLRKVVNELIKDGTIDRDTKVNIEMARDLKNANERIAWQRWQRDRQNDHDRIKEQIKKDIKAATGRDITPSDTDILKYQLWEEQNHVCVYTGQTIAISDFIGDDPKFDIEHTIPRSLSFDNSQANLTLCDRRFNRDVKRNKIPSELPEHDDIVKRLEHWFDKIEELKKNVSKARSASRMAADKSVKDGAIQRRHKFEIELKYWQDKYNRFLMKDVPDGFKNSQLVDTGIITKYARMYLNTVFRNVYTVKGNTVADFRRFWGIQDEYEKKERVNHIHHCIDAIVIACMSKDNYERLAKFYHDWDGYKRAEIKDKPSFDMPCEGFPEKIKQIENEVLISHYTPDNLPKKSNKKLRVRGRIQKNDSGEILYQKGSSIRGSLHKETNYGAIKRSILNKKGELEGKIIYVVRKPLDSITANDIKNIVDPVIRKIVEEGKPKEGELKKQLEKAEKRLRDTEMPEEQSVIKEEIENYKDQLDNLYAIKNKNGSYTKIKKVRCHAPTVTNPLPIKKYRDADRSPDYKSHSHFANDSNYMMAIYEGEDRKGNIKRDFRLVNNLDAGLYFLGKSKDNPIPDIHPKSGFPLKCLLKTGTMVIFRNTSGGRNLLYKCVSFEGDGRVVFRFHLEARQDKELNRASVINMDAPESKLRLSLRNLDMMVEGFDFKLSPTGKLEMI